MFVVGKRKMNFYLIYELKKFLFSRDADEQLVLAHVWNKLANVVQILTIHIFKDDWLRHQTHTFLQPQTGNHNTANIPTPSSSYNGFVVVT